MSVSEVFHRITSALDEAGIAYVRAGSFASAYFGAPRTTQDIDFVIATAADQLRTLGQLLSYIGSRRRAVAITRDSPNVFPWRAAPDLHTFALPPVRWR